jgi:hypothetical protein
MPLPSRVVDLVRRILEIRALDQPEACITACQRLAENARSILRDPDVALRHAQPGGTLEGANAFTQLIQYVQRMDAPIGLDWASLARCRRAVFLADAAVAAPEWAASGPAFSRDAEEAVPDNFDDPPDEDASYRP